LRQVAIRDLRRDTSAKFCRRLDSLRNTWPMSDYVHIPIAAAAAFMAGGINSVAGGGTLISFPTLVWLGLPPITANATSTVAIWPGSLGSIWGFRSEFGRTERRLKLLAGSSLIGGAVGAILLRSTPAVLFERLVPFLILLATILFVIQGPIQKRLREGSGSSDHSGIGMPVALALNLLVAVYGGYFGAGMSIMMLSFLSLLGLTDILQMDALTSLFSLCVNGVAAILFISLKMVDWHYVLPMAAAAILGGYGAAGLARRIGKVAVRRFVIGVGFAVSTVLFIRLF
jgi:uncharacterized protein